MHLGPNVKLCRCPIVSFPSWADHQADIHLITIFKKRELILKNIVNRGISTRCRRGNIWYRPKKPHIELGVSGLADILGRARKHGNYFFLNCDKIGEKVNYIKK